VKGKSWEAGIAQLVHQVGLGVDFELHQLAGGANNRVYRVDVDGRSVLLKAYFQHKNDPRDRLGTEYAFANFAWEVGLRCLPKPLAMDGERKLGLYEFVSGRKLFPREVGKESVGQALSFFRGLNLHKENLKAQGLSEGSEACFSIEQHMMCVERRLKRLCEMEVCEGIDSQAKSFIHTEMAEKWGEIADSVRRQADESGLLLHAKIATMDRCLSPSDFGFHNAILGENGQLSFIDFEYAGWDDVAKVVGDFFCQPALPVPIELYDFFVEEVTRDLSHPEIHVKRITLLKPVYQMKWCCILLNDFLPIGSQRRDFAGNPLQREKQKVGQLEKARDAFREII
jgi:hypothetical protein